MTEMPSLFMCPHCQTKRHYKIVRKKIVMEENVLQNVDVYEIYCAECKSTIAILPAKN